MAFTSGKYYPEAAAGRVFIGSTAAAGVSPPISTGTAITFGLWNTSTAQNAVLLQLNAGYTSGTIALGEFGIGVQAVGLATGTGAPMAAATVVEPVNAIVGAGKGSGMSFISSTATLTAGTNTVAYWLGVSKESATAGLGLWTFQYDFDGTLIVPPGSVAFLCASVAATEKITASLTWAEVDI